MLPVPRKLTLNCSGSASFVVQATVLAMILPAAALPAAAQTSLAQPRTIVIPPSSRAHATDLGTAAHTNVRYADSAVPSPKGAPSYAQAVETPQSIACLYGVVPYTPGCNPATATNTPSGGSETIAIVDAYDDPNASSDLANFAAQWGVPYTPGKFKVVYAAGTEPGTDPTGGWELEESLDIEYSHSMAPNAMLYLVEANSNSNADLYTAVQVAGNLIACGKTTTCPAGSKGKGEISMSWGETEYTAETSSDSNFTTPNVVYFASAGDDPGPIYPCVSPAVVCAGGTSTARNEFTGNLIGEITWQDGGGGISSYESTPGYQSFLKRELGGQRGVPDVSSDSNPNTGVWVLDTFPVPGPGWYVVGGTSVASPTIAGIVNASGNFASSSSAELKEFYGYGDGDRFHDIFYGACGYYSGTFSVPGWDQCTGLGSPADLHRK